MQNPHAVFDGSNRTVLAVFDGSNTTVHEREKGSADRRTEG